MHASTLRHPEEERYVFRPWGELALVGFAMSLVLFTGVWTQIPGASAAGAGVPSPPTLNLSASGDFQQAVHFNFDAASQERYRQRSFVAPRYALTVSPQDWVRIYTNSPVGLPRSARARFYQAAGPEACFGNVMIGCVEVDTADSGYAVPLHPEAASSFGFTAPATPGAYWIALQADWGFGATTQVFVIEVRA